MKRQSVENKIEVSGNFNRHQFRFDNNADMFQLIISQLYSRPIEAIVRELSCNAYDAHVDAGTKVKPFVVKLPNDLDHTFYIRDYGTGLTPEQVYNLYTVVGLSDKTHSNDYVGAFGVGSKSPFAYTDQFSVESIVDGTKWIYSAHMNKDGIPEIADLSDGGFPTDEENGLKISFDINRNEWHAFYQVCRKVFYPFDVKPVILGYETDYIISEKNYKIEGDRWGYRDSTPQQLMRNKNYAIMGNVLYEIDTEQIKDYNHICGFDLYFDIGELTPAASREYLQYDDETVENILTRLREIEEYLEEKYSEEFRQVDSVFEARKKWHEFRHSSDRNSLVYQVVSDAITNFEFNGQPWSLTKTAVGFKDLFASLSQDERGFKILAITDGTSKTVVKSATSRYKKIPLVDAPWRGDVTEPYYVIVDDPYCKIVKTKHLSRQNPDNTYYLFDSDCEKIEKSLLRQGVTPDHILKVSDLVRPAPAQRPKKATKTELDKQKKYIWKYRTNSWGYYGRNVSDIWSKNDEVTETDLKAPGVYVVRNSYYWNFEGGPKRGYRYDVHDLKSIYSAISNLGQFDMPTIYSAPPSKIDLLPDHWIRLDKFMENMYTWILSGTKASVDLVKSWKEVSGLVDEHNSYGFKALLSYSDVELAKVSDDKVIKWAEELSDIAIIQKKFKKFSKFENLCKSYLGIEKARSAGKKVIKDDFEKFLAYFKKEYPMMNYICDRYGSSCASKEEVIDYMNLVYDCKQEEQEKK